MAWQHAKPGKDRETRAVELKRQYGADCRQLELPDVGSAGHIIEYLFELGPAVRGEEITHGDVVNFQRIVGPISEFEGSMLVKLSRAYLSQHHASSGKAVPAPWRRELTAEEQWARDRLKEQARLARDGKDTTR